MSEPSPQIVAHRELRSSSIDRVLTGIKPTGTPHLGNYVGAIRPAILSSRLPNVESFYFLADYHALAGSADPTRVHRSTLEVAASWLALGLDPDVAHFYRQSDIPEVTELTWLLACVAPKGLLNRAHAYKAAVDQNCERGDDEDAGIEMGLYLYPVLMAADILLFNAHRVPVGKDQIQHIEIARDLAQRFNHRYGEILTLPEAQIDETTATLPGTDGRKMSKSYDNVIPLFASPKALREAIFAIVTNSQLPGEAKDPESSSLFALYQAFASADETAAMRAAYAAGIAWGEAKQRVFERIDQEIAPARARFDALMAAPEAIEAILQRGAMSLRPRAQELLKRMRDAVGLRPLTATHNSGKRSDKKAKGPRIVQYKEGAQFFFKLQDADGEVLLVGPAYAEARDAGAAIAGFLKGEMAPELQALIDAAPNRAAIEAARVALIDS